MTPSVKTGSDHDSWCTKCKMVLAHVVVAMNGNTVMRVQCKTCGGTHAYKAKAPQKGTRSAGKSSAAAGSSKQNQEIPLTPGELANAMVYTPGFLFAEGDVVRHNQFGMGKVTKELADGKIEVQFPGIRRILIHNRSART